MARLDPPLAPFCRPEPRAPPTRGSLLPARIFHALNLFLSIASFSKTQAPQGSYAYPTGRVHRAVPRSENLLITVRRRMAAWKA